MAPDEQTRYGIQELVQVSGVPRRTIRFYVQRGLLDPPKGAGRGHYYTEGHLQRLLQIRHLQGEGRTLDEIASLLRGGSRPLPAEAVPPVELATRIHLGEGLELLVGQGARAPTLSQLRALAIAAARILAEEGEENDED
jgi:DNA-binding transcriptional MerR regulator